MLEQGTAFMNKSVAVGAVVVFALGAVAFHSLTADTVGTAAQPVVAKPMSPLQMMRRDRDSMMQPNTSEF
jgi:hypothetical protein